MSNKSKSKKPRTEWIYARTKGKVNKIGLSYEPQSDTIKFETPMERTYHEVTYERKKGLKVLNRVPLEGNDLKLSSNRAMTDYDDIFAVDTNTRIIDEMSVSVTGIVCGKRYIDSKNNSLAVEYYTPFCIEFEELSDPKEKIGWIMAIQELTSRKLINAERKVALVVDAHLEELLEINNQEKLIFDDYMLPHNITLIYSSADVGREYVSNFLIKNADISSSMVLDYLEAGIVQLNQKELTRAPFKRYRVVIPKKNEGCLA